MPDQRLIDGDVSELICAEHFTRHGRGQRGRRLSLLILSPRAQRRACTVVGENSGETLRTDPLDHYGYPMLRSRRTTYDPKSACCRKRHT